MKLKLKLKPTHQLIVIGLVILAAIVLYRRKQILNAFAAAPAVPPAIPAPPADTSATDTTDATDTSATPDPTFCAQVTACGGAATPDASTTPTDMTGTDSGGMDTGTSTGGGMKHSKGGKKKKKKGKKAGLAISYI